jgi:predicted ArsR family transcriptional regulator
VTRFCYRQDAAVVARRLAIHHETVREYFDKLARKGWLKGHTSPAAPKDWTKR